MPFGMITEGIKRLDQQIKNAPDHIRFAGLFSLADMPSIYAAADLFLFLSYQENCPLAPMEAAASGMPVIYRDIEEYKVLYKNEYWKAKNNSEFIDWIKCVMADTQLYQKGLSISEKLMSQFDKRYIRKQLIRLYRTILDASLKETSIHKRKMSKQHAI